MTTEESAKLGYGNYERVNTAVGQGKLDARDLVITKDTSEFIYIRDDLSRQVIRPRLRCFDDVFTAINELNKSQDTYAGQFVCIKNEHGDYEPYMVQQGTSIFEVRPMITQQQPATGISWVRF